MWCRLISRAWEIAGTRYEDPNLAKKCSTNLLSLEDGEMSLEFYNCRSRGGITHLNSCFYYMYVCTVFLKSCSVFLKSSLFYLFNRREKLEEWYSKERDTQPMCDYEYFMWLVSNNHWHCVQKIICECDCYVWYFFFSLNSASVSSSYDFMILIRNFAN